MGIGFNGDYIYNFANYIFRKEDIKNEINTQTQYLKRKHNSAYLYVVYTFICNFDYVSPGLVTQVMKIDLNVNNNAF